MLHEYDFNEIDPQRGKINYQEFIKMLNWLTSQNGVGVMSISQASKAIEDLSVIRFIYNKFYWKISSLIPPVFSKPVGVYLSADNVIKLVIKLSAFVVLFYLAILLMSIAVAFWLGSMMFSRSNVLRSRSLYVGLAVLVLISIYAFHNLEISFKGALVITMLLGGCLGL